MSIKESFIPQISEGYTFEGPSITLGGAMLEGACLTGNLIRAPLEMFNRHGLISGSTGTGKTKSLQVIAEQLSDAGVPVLLMDVKGDLSGLAVASDGHPKIDERQENIGLAWEGSSYPVEFLTISEEKGVRMRATVTEFGPVLFARLLNLTEAQSGIIAVIFKYCDDHNIPLLDIQDLRRTMQWMMNEGEEEIKNTYGGLSTVSANAILRKLVTLEQQGAEVFFGEPSFDIDDLMQKVDGKGVINILRLTDIQDRPLLFSTFMLQLLAEVYSTLPEEGDLEKPKLVLFIDEAHLVFDNATDSLLDQIEMIMKLIRSKSVGVFYVTQNPTDIPNDVLSQLGMKVQHALRAFTARDRKAIKLSSENFPLTNFYDLDELLTQLGTGEALVTVLNEDGAPTPVVHTMMRAPQSRMDVLEDQELNMLIERSRIFDKYAEVLDRESAEEILNKKIESAREGSHQKKLQEQLEKGRARSSRSKKPESIIEEIMTSPAAREMSRTFARELSRGLLSALGVRSTSRRRKR